ncbi:glutamate ABC transporter substrate-binding protein [Micrococcales bacterium 31B]|nr:glutamate ABC transporter substrate-binding protein [Micrococcales bacterium 31B]
MRSTKKFLTVCAAAMTLVLAGCGSSSTAGEGATPAATTFAAGTTMEKIQKAGKLRVGVKFDQPLFGQKAPDGKVQGFDIEIAKIIATDLGLSEDQIEYQEAVSANREPFIMNDKVDIVIATYTINDERKKSIDFAGPYYEAGQAILVKKGNPKQITTPDTLSGKNVCSVTGSTPAENIAKLVPDATVTLFDTYAKCVTALNNGQTDAVTTDNVILAGFVAKSPDDLELADGGKTFTKEPYGIGLKKGDEEFRTFINDTLEKAEKDGRWKAAWDNTAGTVISAEPTPPAIDRYTAAS